MPAPAPRELRFHWRCSKVIRLVTSLGGLYGSPVNAFRVGAIRNLERRPSWRKIAITLKTRISKVNECDRLLAIVMAGRRSEQCSFGRLDYFWVARQSPGDGHKSQNGV
jgi:hypothetical protein